MKKYKLGISYNLFCGEELLKDSILSIKDCVDYINVVWQRVSWTGQKAEESLETLLLELKSEGLIDNIIEYSFDIDKVERNYKKYSCAKKNLGLKDLRHKKCTHFMLMDVDEFYRKKEFLKAKEFVYTHKITHSVCSIYDYRVSPQYREIDARDYCVGFIFKLYPYTRVIGFGRVNNLPCYIDALRAVPYLPFLHRFYYLNMVSMRHMTGVRKNFHTKAINTISNYTESGRRVIKKFESLQKKVENMDENALLNSGYIKVKDEFGILKNENF